MRLSDIGLPLTYWSNYNEHVFFFSTVKQHKSEYGKRLKTGWPKPTARLGLEPVGVFTYLRLSGEK